MKEGWVKGEGFAVDASLIKADANRQRARPGEERIDWGDPKQSTRAVREYVAALDEDSNEEGQGRDAPKSISLTDPKASWTAAAGPAFFAYCTNYLIDLGAGNHSRRASDTGLAPCGAGGDQDHDRARGEALRV